MQIVFCDRSTPHQKDGRWSIYEGLREELVTRGVPPEAIRFIHDYPKPGDKAQLFADCRNGRVAVIMGSTEKMGTGTNIQERAVALHRLDVPWRPSDLEQREGRIIRQGNKNPSVEILSYVTQGTFDTIMWQTVGEKGPLHRAIEDRGHRDADRRRHRRGHGERGGRDEGGEHRRPSLC